VPAGISQTNFGFVAAIQSVRRKTILFNHQSNRGFMRYPKGPAVTCWSEDMWISLVDNSTLACWSDDNPTGAIQKDQPSRVGQRTCESL
jgi:hypothetical protein